MHTPCQTATTIRDRVRDPKKEGRTLSEPSRSRHERVGGHLTKTRGPPEPSQAAKTQSWLFSRSFLAPHQPCEPITQAVSPAAGFDGQRG